MSLAAVIIANVCLCVVVYAYVKERAETQRMIRELLSEHAKERAGLLDRIQAPEISASLRDFEMPETVAFLEDIEAEVEAPFV